MINEENYSGNYKRPIFATINYASKNKKTVPCLNLLLGTTKYTFVVNLVQSVLCRTPDNAADEFWNFCCPYLQIVYFMQELPCHENVTVFVLISVKSTSKIYREWQDKASTNYIVTANLLKNMRLLHNYKLIVAIVFYIAKYFIPKLPIE